VIKLKLLVLALYYP